MSGSTPIPELLAPAGNWDCLRAAVENGADAVYLGLATGFNARARADNFGLDDLPEAVQYARQRGVRTYVTLNTLAFSDELSQVEAHVRTLAAAGVDAVLVQDFGVARLVRAAAPELSIHASTQMTLTSSQSIAVAAELGIARVVAARELSVDELARIGRESTMPLEAFVHGALCVAYSGQCLTSESLGGRSANRGECAQACRLAYDLVCDGRDVDLGEQKYLLSPQDLAAYDLLPDLLRAGICSLKIEGRLKTPEYVANVARHYRQAIDAAAAGAPRQFTDDDVEQMELSFSRGFSPGWLAGCDHKRLVPGLSSAKRGVRLGAIAALRGGRVRMRIRRPVRRGDGVAFDGDRSRNEHQGGRVFEIFLDGKSVVEAPAGAEVELAFARDALDFGRLRAGLGVWKNDDPQLNRRLRRTFDGKEPLRRVALALRVRAAVGEPLRIEGRTATGLACRFTSAAPLEPARRRPADEEFFRCELARWGRTVYFLDELQCELAGGPMVPLSLLGEARRCLQRELAAAAARPAPLPTAPPDALGRLRAPLAAARRPPIDAPGTLHVLCRSLSQLAAVCEAGYGEASADFADIRQYGEAVAIARAQGARILLATPRIQKPDEYGLFRAIWKRQPDGLLVRNLGGVRFAQENAAPWVADFSLNAANELTVDWLKRLGAARVTASYDLNRDQLRELAAQTPADWLEVVIHQHMPMFHMEHCVFCAVLSPGTDKHTCGRPCDRHQVRLRDRVGMEHPLTADVGCRNTLFNAAAQSAAEIVPELLAAGVRNFRVELLETTPEPLHVLGLYRRLLAGDIAPAAVWRALRADNRVGVTRGVHEQPRNPLAIL
jgi:putative protease